jgi:ribose 5-phosphate isomerase B
MRVYFAADHAGFQFKKNLMPFVQSLGHESEDCGAFELDAHDDYTSFIATAAGKLAADSSEGLESRAILIGASGQGEAMAANRIKGVRCGVLYAPAGTQKDASGHELDMVDSLRAHNNANALALGARFLAEEAAQKMVEQWLKTPFSNDQRHIRRNLSLDTLA